MRQNGHVPEVTGRSDLHAERAATELLSPAGYQAVQGVELTPAWPPGAGEGD